MKSKYFVPFDTAQRLKEKGYPQDSNSFQECDLYYYDDGELEAGIAIDTDELDDCFAAPTYHEVVDWLYKKKICITCHPAYSYEGQYNGFRYEMQTYDEDDYPDDVYSTREEALNEAIIAALEML